MTHVRETVGGADRHLLARSRRLLWLFWLVPIIGAAIAGFTYRAVLEGEHLRPPVTGREAELPH
jgi:hypothetical protein